MKTLIENAAYAKCLRQIIVPKCLRGVYAPKQNAYANL